MRYKGQLLRRADEFLKLKRSIFFTSRFPAASFYENIHFSIVWCHHHFSSNLIVKLHCRCDHRCSCQSDHCRLSNRSSRWKYTSLAENHSDHRRQGQCQPTPGEQQRWVMLSVTRPPTTQPRGLNRTFLPGLPSPNRHQKFFHRSRQRWRQLWWQSTGSSTRFYVFHGI